MMLNATRRFQPAFFPKESLEWLLLKTIGRHFRIPDFYSSSKR